MYKNEIPITTIQMPKTSSTNNVATSQDEIIHTPVTLQYFLEYLENCSFQNPEISQGKMHATEKTKRNFQNQILNNLNIRLITSGGQGIPIRARDGKALSNGDLSHYYYY